MSRKLRVEIDNLSEDTSPDSAADFIVTKDTSASLLKRVKPSNILGTALTALKTVFTAASSSAAALLQFHEDTDNGSNYVAIQGPASVASNKTQTLQDVTGTIALTADVTTILRSYLATTETYNNDAVLGDTALSVSVAASGIYAIELVVHSTSAVKALLMDFGGTATITNFIGEWWAHDATDATISAAARVTSAGADWNSALDGLDSVHYFKGSIEVNAAGTFLLRGAQNAADASNTTILRGSTLILTKMS